MKKKILDSENLSLKRDNNRWRTTGLALGLANLILVITVFSVIGAERTIVVPAVTHKTFWLEDENASQEYLEQMAVFFTELALNVSPSNADYQKDLFLKYTDPRSHGVLQTRLSLGVEKIKRKNASTTFFPIELETDVKNKIVVVHGEETLIIGQRVISKSAKAYRVNFKMGQGRMYVTEFTEVDKNEPFKVAVEGTGLGNSIN